MCFIKKLKNNNEQALKEIFNLYYTSLYAYVFDKTKSEDISKDIIQLTFIKLWQNRNRLSEKIELSCQIFRIARTTMIDELRKIQTMRKAQLQSNNIHYSEDVNEIVSYNDTMHKLEEIIKQMPPVRQKVFRLSRLYNYSYKEISKILSVSPKTVENHINLAIKFIRPFFSILIFIESLINYT